MTSQASSLFASVQALALGRNPGRGANSTPSTHEVSRNPSPATSIKIGDVQQHGGISASQLQSGCSIEPTGGSLEHAAAQSPHPAPVKSNIPMFLTFILILFGEEPARLGRTRVLKTPGRS